MKDVAPSFVSAFLSETLLDGYGVRTRFEAVYLNLRVDGCAVCAATGDEIRFFTVAIQTLADAGALCV